MPNYGAQFLLFVSLLPTRPEKIPWVFLDFHGERKHLAGLRHLAISAAVVFDPRLGFVSAEVSHIAHAAFVAMWARHARDDLRASIREFAFLLGCDQLWVIDGVKRAGFHVFFRSFFFGRPPYDLGLSFFPFFISSTS